jgi:carbamoyl-phosphate synthase large subunit
MSGTTLLLLSAGSLVGENVIDALGARRQVLRLVATNTEPWAPSLARVDRVVVAPPTAKDPEGLWDLLRTIIEQEHPKLIIPCRDDDVQYLAARRDALQALGVGVPVGSVQGAAPIADKWHSAQFSQAHGLPFAPSAPTDAPELVQALLHQVGWPLLIKPRAGFASGGVRILREPRQLNAVLGRGDLLVQQYLGSVTTLDGYLDDLAAAGLPLFHSFEEMKYSLQAFIGPDGSLWDRVVTRHAMKLGRSDKVELWQDEGLDGLLVRTAAAFSQAGWCGPLNVQCQQRPDGSFAIYEFNGRFTGATSARALLGYDEVGLALSAWAGEPAPLRVTPGMGAYVVRSPRSNLNPSIY